MVGESAPFTPLALKGLIVNPQKPLEFQFIVDTGSNAGVIASEAKQSPSTVIPASSAVIPASSAVIPAQAGIHNKNDINTLGSQIVRQIILPEIEKEVNTGKNFAPLRQIYQALILAKWYKETIQNGLLDAIYTNKKKIVGVNLNDPAVKEQIYNRYLQAYKKGAFNYIKEDPVGVSLRGGRADEAISKGTTIPRKYFSGGTNFVNYHLDITHDRAMISRNEGLAQFLVTIVAGIAVGAIGLGVYHAYSTRGMHNLEQSLIAYDEKKPLTVDGMKKSSGPSFLNTYFDNNGKEVFKSVEGERWKGDELIDRMISSNSDDSKKAAAILLKIEQPKVSVPVLLQALAHVGYPIAIPYKVNRTLRILIEINSPAVPAVFKAMENSGTNVRLNWTDILGADVRTIPALITLLGSDKYGPVVSDVLTEIGPPAVPALLKAAERTNLFFNPLNLRKFLDLLGKIGNDEAITGLIKLENGCNLYEYRSEVIAALGRTKNERAVFFLIQNIKNYDPETQWDIAKAIGMERRGMAISKLNKILKHTGSPEEKKRIRSALHFLGAPKSPDQAMLQTPKATISRLNQSVENGGIDLNQINVKRTGKTVNVQFDQAQLNELRQGGFEGFTPVIINITRISSPFQLLGINPAEEPEALVKV